MSDDGRNDIDFGPYQARLNAAIQNLHSATNEFNKAIDELRDELLLSSNNGTLN